jgi:hypothetical protein
VVLVLAGCGGTKSQKVLGEKPISGPDSALAKPNTAKTGTPDTRWYSQNPNLSHYTISTADELAGLAQIVNGTARWDR